MNVKSKETESQILQLMWKKTFDSDRKKWYYPWKVYFYET